VAITSPIKETKSACSSIGGRIEAPSGNDGAINICGIVSAHALANSIKFGGTVRSRVLKRGSWSPFTCAFSFDGGADTETQAKEEVVAAAANLGHDEHGIALHSTVMKIDFL
jgi:hypothetical protein